MWRRLASFPLTAVKNTGFWLLLVLGVFLASEVFLSSDLAFGGAVMQRIAQWHVWAGSAAQERLHPKVTLVLVSDATLVDYPYTIPTDRGLLAKLVTEIDRSGAEVLALDFLFTKATEDRKDIELARAIASAKATKIVLGALDERGKLTLRQQEFQADFLKRAGRTAQTIGYLNLHTDFDGVVRQSATPFEPAKGPPTYPVSFATRIVEAAGKKFVEPEVEQRIDLLLPPPGQAHPFKTLPAEAFIPGTTAYEAALKSGDTRLDGRIVILSGDFAAQDRHALAIDIERRLAGSEIQAQITAQRLDGRRVDELQPGQAALLLLALGGCGLALGYWVAQSRYAVAVGLGVVVLTIGLIGVDAIVFTRLRIIAPFVVSLLAWYFSLQAGYAWGRFFGKGTRAARLSIQQREQEIGAPS